MARFSERNGYVKPQDILIKEYITPEIQNAICNCLYDLSNKDRIIYARCEAEIWRYYLYNSTHLFNTNQDFKSFFSNRHRSIIPYISGSDIPWFKKLDIIEKVIDFYGLNKQKKLINIFIMSMNKEFERLHFAYRLVGNQIVEITSDEEIKAIETALTNKEESVKLHLQTAINLYAKRPDGDYRNSIKESISAVEALCRKITGENTLGKAISKLENNGIALSNVLKKSFEQLYNYTNDKTTGIRHALMDDTNAPTADEAIFMLVSCSAFINYLTKKINQ